MTTTTTTFLSVKGFKRRSAERKTSPNGESNSRSQSLYRFSLSLSLHNAQQNKPISLTLSLYWGVWRFPPTPMLFLHLRPLFISYSLSFYLSLTHTHPLISLTNTSDETATAHMTFSFFYKSAIHGRSFFIFTFLIRLNQGPLVSEAPTLPT